MSYLTALSEPIHILFNDIATILGVIALVITVFKFPYRRFVAWMKGKESRTEHAAYVIEQVIPKLVSAHDVLDEQMAALGIRMDAMLLELKPNHGTSLRDAINRIEAQTVKQEGMLRGFWMFDEKPMYIATEDNSIAWVNEAMLDLIQRRPWEVLGTAFWSIVAPEDLATLRSEVALATKDKRGGSYVFNIVAPNGVDRVKIHTRSSALQDSTGELVGYVGTAERA